jgi:SNF2 family DNA or RNA helicase
MHVIHAHFAPPQTPDDPGGMLFWAETAEAPPTRVDRRLKRPQRHPFIAATEAVASRLAELVGTPVAGDDRQILLWLPTTKAGPEPSPRLVHDWPPGDDEAPRLRLWAVDGLWLGPADAFALLSALPPAADWPAALRLADEGRFWQAAARLAREALAQQKVLPALVEVEAGKRYQAHWLPVLDDPAVAPRLARLAGAMPAVCRAAAADPADAPAPGRLLDAFLNTTVDAVARRWVRGSAPGQKATSKDALEAWIGALFDEDPRLRAPAARAAHLYAGYAGWLRSLRVAGDRHARVALRLQAPEPMDPDDTSWRLFFLLQARDDPSLLIAARDVWAERGSVLAMFGRRFAQPQEKLLAGLGYVARLFTPVRRALEAARPDQARLSTEEAYTFLHEVAPVLEQNGFGVLVPPWWNKPGGRLGLRLKLAPAAGTTDSTAADRVGPSRLGMDTLVNFEWELALGAQTLSEAEFEALVALKSPLVQIRGQWVQLDPFQIEAAIRFWRQRREADVLALEEALRYGLGAESQIDGLPIDAVEAEGWFGDWLERLKGEHALEPIPAPAGLRATLRPYQAEGLAWLDFMRQSALGGILADDMGLGKTVQMLALIQHLKESGEGPAGSRSGRDPTAGRNGEGLPGPVLLICPTSVVTNWQRESAKFTPDLAVLVHQGADRAAGDDFATRARAADLVVTSFSLARRDAEAIAQVHWFGVVVDEAQHIKNAETRVARVIRQIPAAFRFAMTGTPVENRLSELWAILHFCAPGYLGTRAGFRRNFAKPIEQSGDQAALRRLRRLTGPFILRRLKTDPTVIRDLPAKQEVKVYCPLAPEQASLYASVVQAELEAIESSEEGIGRQGQVLRMLLRLKQICNHPAQFLGQIGGARAAGRAAGPALIPATLAARSGKLARLAELLDEIVAEGDRALIFTQFAEMGHLLHAFLQARLGVPAQFLHGGTPARARDAMVRRFQEDADGPPLFILSLKAGGTGINLTRANHVLHFDRWWNPAVEDQATDRAFRIGQTRKLLVHKFVCTGTLEEKIDAMIEDKKALAAQVIGSGENWLTQLSTAELRTLVALSSEAVGELDE